MEGHVYLRRPQAVDLARALATPFDQIGRELLQVARGARLAKIEPRHDLLGAEFVLLGEQLQDAQARVVGQRAQARQQLGAAHRRGAHHNWVVRWPMKEQPQRRVVIQARDIPASMRRWDKDQLLYAVRWRFDIADR